MMAMMMTTRMRLSMAMSIMMRMRSNEYGNEYDNEDKNEYGNEYDGDDVNRYNDENGDEDDEYANEDKDEDDVMPVALMNFSVLVLQIPFLTDLQLLLNQFDMSTSNDGVPARSKSHHWDLVGSIKLCPTQVAQCDAVISCKHNLFQ
jgi:hypothetical protein